MMNDNFYRSSGAAVAIRRISEALVNVDLYFAGCSDEGLIEDVSWCPDGRFERFDLKSRRPIRVVQELARFRQWFRKHRCDLVHCHHRRLAVLLQTARIPVLYTGHLAFPPAAWFRWLHPRFMTAVSSSVAHNIRETTGREVLRCIKNPVRFPAHPPEIDLAKAKNRAVCIARLEPIKGHTHLLNAWKVLANRGHHFKLELVGEGSLRKQLEKQTRTEGLEALVTFHGYTSDISGVLAEGLFAVLASEVEGQPLAALEAAAMGRATLVTEVPGAVDVLPPGRRLVNGVPFGDPLALADALQEWFLRPEHVACEGALFFDFLKASSDALTIASDYRGLYQLLTGSA